ncbi:tail fiber protein [Salmonella enterica subsp. enterica serovar Typhi]|nr:phage tail protein [Salmonella enterica]HCG4898563.1 tail fiber protein [Salmonella enterica subsp. enterica serovar Typhi str. AG3]EAS0429593.1 phage tail protein [Salmonella enterica]EEI9588038.1 phage tail protein [Salmonella enterica subsp. enterica serovar Typhi]EIE2673319.1 tail fiber protein [Salmonella enterica subsp. enterica serovar Typhi]EIE2740524.1 tail fiber protein [Salmonella enterica subsp. enterica serovar Typhi]
MANLPETPQWESGIYQIEVSDPVLGGPDGISNRQAKQLASRTSYLKQKVEKSGTDLAAHIAAVDPHTQYATKASPTFTGTPTAPTPANGDNSKKLATTEFVAKALAALAGSAPETLDTLKELADALGNDPNFATTVLNKLAEKLAKDQNGADIPEPALFVKNLGLGEGSALPVGVPVPWPSATPPAGWLKCNGAAFSSEMYPNLAKAYPANKLPDLRGEFIRGWDDERGIDPGRQLLEWQKGTLVGGRDDNDAAVDISYMSNGNSIDYGGDKTFSTNYRSDYLWYAILGNVTSRAKAALSGSFFNVTRPRNIAFNYIVRAT